MKLKPWKKLNTKRKKSEKWQLQAGQELTSTNQNSCQRFLGLTFKPLLGRWEKREIKLKGNSRFWRRYQMMSCNVCSKRKSYELSKMSVSRSIFNDVYKLEIINKQSIKHNIVLCYYTLQIMSQNIQPLLPFELPSDPASLIANQQQVTHQNQILLTFMNYHRIMQESSPGIELYNRPKRIQDIKYYQLLQQKKRQKFEEAIKANQQFLYQIVNYCQGQQRLSKIQDKPISYSNFSKVKTTIKQFYREWSDEGRQVKDYANIVQRVKPYLTKGDKVLAPGSGLGRLVLEFVEAGFACQGNQVSYFMLYGSNFILNAADEQRQYKIYPFISSPDYYYNQEDIFRSVMVPDKAACKIVSEDADFSMAGGEFTEVYSKMPLQFHCVATCFFIDTANNIFDYVDTIYTTLKPNGTWVNYGPLLFHYRDVYKQVSIQVTWQVLRKYIEKKFDFLNQSMNETTYDHDERSEMGVKYNCITFVCRKK